MASFTAEADNFRAPFKMRWVSLNSYNEVPEGLGLVDQIFPVQFLGPERLSLQSRIFQRLIKKFCYCNGSLILLWSKECKFNAFICIIYTLGISEKVECKFFSSYCLLK